MPFLLGALPLIAILAAPLAGPIANRLRAHPGWISAAVTAGLLAALAALAAPTWSGQTPRLSLDWFPDVGLRYALALDGLALLFAGLILAVGVLVFVYSVAYMHAGQELGRFYAHMLIFMGAMLGVVLADDLVVLYVFWELTSLASFFLIGYRNEDPDARAGATTALVVTVAGGVALLVGLVMLAQAGGTWQISALLTRAAAIKADPAYPVILALVLTGAFTKSAQVPFQFWLPSAMVAPTPVSTYLHAATMVWAGVYLLARLLPVLGGTALWVAAVTPAGLATLLVGGSLALVATDLKGLLAYSTVGALGLATALLGWGTPAAVGAAMVFVLNHAAFKGALFLVAGAVEHETGTRVIDRLGGLRRGMPLTFGVAALAAFSMAGLPPFGGFLSKEAAVEAFLHGPWAATGAVILSGALSLAYGARYMWIFLGGPPQPRRAKARADAPPPPESVHEPPALLYAPAGVLAVVALAFGLAPGAVERLAGLAAAAITGAPQRVALWHGPTLVAVVALTTAVGGGWLLFRLHPLAAQLETRLRWMSAGRLYDRAYAATLGGAKVLTGLYLTGRLRDYLIYITGTAVALVAFGFARTGIAASLLPGEMELGPTITVLVAMTAAVAAVRMRLLLGAVLALGAAGYSVSLIYLLLSAPDIAITQAVIETVSLVLFLVAISALGKSDLAHPPARPATDWLAATAAGGAGAVMAAMVAAPSALQRISGEFFTHAAQAGGKNLVNLIIVDFRGWDTMGEISVLAIAALGIVSLAPWRRAGSGAERRKRGEAREGGPFTTLILRTIARAVSPVIVAYALLLLATGHYGPGGGFVAGLMISAAVVLRSEAFGAALLARRWDILMAAGLALAAGSSAIPLVAGKPLLQHTLLVVAGHRLPSSLFFDLGVMLLVTGAVLAAMRSLVEAAGGE